MAVGVRPNLSVAHSEAAPGAALLFERYSERLQAYCLYVLRDRREAEDAVQTTYLQALRALKRGVTPANEYAWLHAIAKNVCRTQQRTAARRVRVVHGVDVDAIPGGCDADDGQELQRDLRAALASLPERQRRALLLREWRGLSSDEVAEQLGMSAPATYALLTRARKSLAAALTTTVRRPLSSLNVGLLLDTLRTYLKTFFGSAASKAAIAAVATTASVGGLVAQQSLADDVPARPAGAPNAEGRPSAAGDRTVAPSSTSDVTAPASSPRTGRVERSAPMPSSPVARPPTTTSPATAGAPAQPVDPKAPPTQEAPPSPTPETNTVPAPRPELPLPPLPLLPDLSSEDPLLPPVEVPPLPPVPELPPVELPPVEPLQLPPTPPLPGLP